MRFSWDDLLTSVHTPKRTIRSPQFAVTYLEYITNMYKMLWSEGTKCFGAAGYICHPSFAQNVENHVSLRFHAIII